MKTALFDDHQSLGAKIVDFHGWQMPLHYSKGGLHEHRAVREAVGIFDVSHMGRITITGSDAASFVERLCTNSITKKGPYSASYTVFARSDGSSVDDALIYKVDETTFFTVVNAGNRAKDLAHIRAMAQDAAVTITDHYDTEGILAIQGPQALSLVETFFPGEVEILKRFQFCNSSYEGVPCIISRTGYTGSGGVEIYGDNSVICSLWKKNVAKGAEPVGLAARDTLRLEMGYALYGHELSDLIAPTESVSAWAVDLSKENFIGKEALLQLEEDGQKRKQYGVTIIGKAIAREGCPVTSDGERVGNVTSGTFSPSLKRAIAIIMVRKELAIGDRVEIEIRGSATAAEVVALPFFNPSA